MMIYTLILLLLMMRGNDDDGGYTPAPLTSREARVLGVEPYIDSETLWLARCIYSETDRIDEMRVVAWVVRNRVEAGYRGQSSYRGVVLDPFQFSAFNRRSPRRAWYSKLDTETGTDRFNDAVAVAYDVHYADRSEAPIPNTVMHFYSPHFYSPVSMRRNRVPAWVKGGREIAMADINSHRFKFYEGVR
jgi:hypothetical protein